MATTKDRFREQENLAAATARLCARYGADAVIAEATKCKNRRYRCGPLVRRTGKGNRDREIGHILLEIARRLEQDPALRDHTAANDVVCSKRDSGYWNANWTIVYKLDDRLKNVAKGYVRRFLKEERLHRSRYLMAVASEANRSKVDHMYTDYLIKIGKDNLNEPRSETDISEDFLNALREVVSDDVRRDRELTSATVVPMTAAG